MKATEVKKWQKIFEELVAENFSELRKISKYTESISHGLLIEVLKEKQ